jgi:hypothetical protein
MWFVPCLITFMVHTVVTTTNNVIDMVIIFVIYNLLFVTYKWHVSLHYITFLLLFLYSNCHVFLLVGSHVMPWHSRRTMSRHEMQFMIQYNTIHNTLHYIAVQDNWQDTTTFIMASTHMVSHTLAMHGDTAVS